MIQNYLSGIKSQVSEVIFVYALDFLETGCPAFYFVF